MLPVEAPWRALAGSIFLDHALTGLGSLCIIHKLLTDLGCWICFVFSGLLFFLFCIFLLVLLLLFFFEAFFFIALLLFGNLSNSYSRG